MHNATAKKNVAFREASAVTDIPSRQDSSFFPWRRQTQQSVSLPPTPKTHTGGEGRGREIPAATAASHRLDPGHQAAIQRCRSSHEKRQNKKWTLRGSVPHAEQARARSGASAG
jgi:hypothetical protein